MEILVKATAKAEKMPDTMIVKIDFFGLRKDKEESLKLLNTNVNSIKEYLSTKGISWDSVTTSKFGVSEEYTNQRVVVKKLGREETDYQKVFVGYRTKQSISFTKDLDIELAVKLIAEVTKNEEIGVNIEYTLKDFTKFQSEVMKLAIDNAKIKAQSIAESFDLDKVTCTNVDYTYVEQVTRSSYKTASLDCCCFAEEDSFSAALESIAENINPDPIIWTESVKTTWLAEA